MQVRDAVGAVPGQGIPMFSIVTVVRNAAASLERTYASVESQVFRDFEWVVIDGCSTDGTVEVLRALGSKVRKYVSEPDRGIYDAMNKGIALSSGRFILFMNAGDVFSGFLALESVARNLAEQPELPDVVFGGATLQFRNGSSWYREPRKIEEYVWHGVPANHQATYYSAGRLKAHLYDTNFRICGDYWMAASLFKQGVSATYLQTSVVDFEVNGVSYHHPVRLLLECNVIQRDVLGLGRATRARSAMKRAIAMAVGAALSQKVTYWVCGRLLTGKTRCWNRPSETSAAEHSR